MEKNQKLIDLRGTKTLLQVATDLGISVSALSHYELGRRFPVREIAIKIANYYGVTVDELFYGGSYTICETANTESPLQHGGDAQ